MKHLRKAALAATALASLAVATPANAATILLNGVDSISNAGARAGFKIAAKYWESMLTNNATVNFDVALAALKPRVLAQAGSTRADIAVTTAYAALAANANSALDAVALGSLATQIAGGGGYSVDALVSSLADVTTTINDNNGSMNNAVLWENTAVLKAMGFTGFSGPDAGITFSSLVAFDFNPSDGITTGQSDFVGVAIHEMGHALGFTSGVDLYDVFACPGGPGCGSYTDADFDQYSLMRTLDLFRYSSAGQLDWTVGTPSYFSIDNGLTEFNGEASFSSGSYQGDGWQASHWQAPRADPPYQDYFSCVKDKLGIMNPYLCNGQAGFVEGHDIAALDAIGWNTSVDALANPNYRASSGDIYSQFIGQVPEPSTWALLILGFGLTGAAMRRKGKVAARFAF